MIARLKQPSGYAVFTKGFELFGVQGEQGVQQVARKTNLAETQWSYNHMPLSS